MATNAVWPHTTTTTTTYYSVPYTDEHCGVMVAELSRRGSHRGVSYIDREMKLMTTGDLAIGRDLAPGDQAQTQRSTGPRGHERPLAAMFAAPRAVVAVMRPRDAVDSISQQRLYRAACSTSALNDPCLYRAMPLSFSPNPARPITLYERFTRTDTGFVAALISSVPSSHLYSLQV